MIKNVNLKLIDKSNRRIWIDDAFVPESLLKRLFRALNKATDIIEQNRIIETIEKNDGYNENAVYTYIYKYGCSDVKYQICHFNKENGTFKRGIFVGNLNLK